MELSTVTIQAWQNLPRYTALDLAFLAAGYEPVEYLLAIHSNQINYLVKKQLERLKEIMFRDDPGFKKYVLESKDTEERNKRLLTQSLSHEHAKKYLVIPEI